jgi:hypothetical protein
VTSDGTSVRAYLNGSPLGSPATAALGAITAPLQLGAWINGSSNSDFLSGTLDEVRVYGRALSAAEIQADMATPIASGGPDTSPPVLSGGSPAGVLPASTTEASLQVTTSEAANCRYGSAPGVAYSGQPSTFTTTGGQAHASLVTGLTPGTTSTFYVRCQDLAGNATTSDYTISFSVAGGLNISSLQFFGNGTGQIDRVEVPLTAGSSINVGGDFTIEWWMRTDAGNGSGACATANNDWIYGNILIDRDVFGAGDNGDYGVSLFGATGQIAFGVSRGNSGTTLCSSVGVADGAWHHVAVTRRGDNGVMAIFIDGVARGSTTGPSGDVSYRQGHVGAENDPVLVFGAEKHDAGAEFPSYHGRLDEIRISSAIRYAGPFAVPTTALAADGATVALYHFDEGAGTVAHDATGNDDGAVLFGGNPVGPVWSSTVPF